MTIVRLSGADVISVEESEESLQVRQYHVDFRDTERLLLEDAHGTYEVKYPPGAAEKEWLREYAGLVFQVGDVLCTRREPSVLEEGLVWEYLYANVDSVYDRIAPRIDDIETEVFG